MKRLAWSPALVIAILGGIAANDSACTLTIGGDDGGNPFTDDSGSVQDTSTAGDTGTQVDTGTAADAGTTADTGATTDVGTTTDGGSCAILQQVSFGSVACDTCLGSSCCDPTTVCFTGAESLCADLVGCFGDCLVGNADAGVPPGTTASCQMDCAGPDASVSTFNAFVACETNSCAARCQ